MSNFTNTEIWNGMVVEKPSELPFKDYLTPEAFILLLVIDIDWVFVYYFQKRFCGMSFVGIPFFMVVDIWRQLSFLQFRRFLSILFLKGTALPFEFCGKLLYWLALLLWKHQEVHGVGFLILLKFYRVFR